MEDGYAYSCRTVSNKLLARIAAKMHKAVLNRSAHASRNHAASALENSLPRLPTHRLLPNRRDRSRFRTPVEPTESKDSQAQPAGVSISALERRLNLLKALRHETRHPFRVCA